MPLVAASSSSVDAQVAVVVERLDDRAGERVIALLERQHVDLAVQVLAQADVGGDHVERADVAVARPAGARSTTTAASCRARTARRRSAPIASRSMPRGSPSPSAAAMSTSAGVVRRILDLEEGIAAHRVVHFLGEIERGELQQPHRVLQARRDGVLLPLARLQGREAHRSVSVRCRFGKRRRGQRARRRCRGALEQHPCHDPRARRLPRRATVARGFPTAAPASLRQRLR